MRSCFVKINIFRRQKATYGIPESEHLNNAAHVFDEQVRHSRAYGDVVGERKGDVERGSAGHEFNDANSNNTSRAQFNADVVKAKYPNNVPSDKLKECTHKGDDNNESDKATIISNAKNTIIDSKVNEMLNKQSNLLPQNEEFAVREHEGRNDNNKSKYFKRSATSPSLGGQATETHACGDKARGDIEMLSDNDKCEVKAYRSSYGDEATGNNNTNNARSVGRSNGIFRIFLGGSKKKKKNKKGVETSESENEFGMKKRKKKECEMEGDKKAPLAAMESQQLGVDEDEGRTLTKIEKPIDNAPKATKEACSNKANNKDDYKTKTTQTTSSVLDKTQTEGKTNNNNTDSRHPNETEPQTNVIAVPTAPDKSSEAHNEQSYIAEYKSFVEDEKPNLIGTPFPETEAFNFEKVLNRTTSKCHSSDVLLPLLHTSKQADTGAAARFYLTPYNNTNPNPPKTPEEIEYEANIAAESVDVMTPLPNTATFTAAHKSFSVGRPHASDIVDMIRNLDTHTLRINNMTIEEKVDLMRRFEEEQREGEETSHSLSQQSNQQKQYAQNSLRHFFSSGTLNFNSLRLLTIENRFAAPGSTQAAFNTASTIVQQLQGGVTSETICDSDDGEEVVLRRKLVDNSDAKKLTMSTCLYERRLPQCPKLKLYVYSQYNDNRLEDSGERSLMDVKFPTVLPPNPQIKVLLVFHKSDNICEVLTEACNRQQLDVTLARTKESALETLSSTSEEFYHLIIIDARSTKHLDAEYIARSIRHTNGHHFTTIIAVVKKSFFEKDDVLIALLDAGVNRCVPETTNLSMCNIELKQILHSIVRPHNVMSTQQALYTALHRLKEVILITDNHLRIQYANRSAERLLNMRLDEIISKPLADIFVSDVSTVMVHGRKNKEFDEILTVRRKGQEDVSMHIRVIPVACIGRTPTHYVFNLDVPGSHVDFVATLPQAREAPRGSQHSIRRGSSDVRSVASDGLRRTSLAKLTSLPLEAPITKENCSADEARLIDKVLEFLKREGLYSPQMKEIRTDDPIATDLIGALLTGPSLYSSRRSSNDSIIRVTGRQSTCMPAKMKATPHIMELLEESLSWEFDIFKLEEITEKRPLLYLGMELFRRFNVFATLNIDENVCKSWLAVMEANYHANNSYHNSTHAADVMQATGCFLTQLAAKDMGMDHTDEAIALIAAAAHDVDHPGRSSAFLCNSRNTLALLYNDLCVLESHHASITFRLTLSDDKVNIFKNLDTETYKSVRSVVIDMILATEMTRHFEHLAKFVSIFGTDEEPKDIVQSEDESAILIRRMLIKVADVNNPSRQPSYCVEWARRIAEEYFTQTDEEKAKALPIVMPMFDRNTCSIPKSQIGFIEYIIQDMVHAWDSFIDMPQLVTYMQINYSQWKKFEDQGVHTLADVKSKQHSLSAKKNVK
ncbi:high affinity cAMP-specific and IBMX-insensitive 3',5'-cyclic phosphodiesterase 8 isoform X2 [Eurosta solidaginis]|uniref:high affinity cAMP-specific and IBMX-insensitive 3',5'-cyclic phosphodiesterase 8 isoform X2 n=1 Tax=Eurosta solidaginis TaxID=178769 RepID=UPI003530A237